MERREFGGELTLSHEGEWRSSLCRVCRAPVIDLTEQVLGVRLDVAPRPQSVCIKRLSRSSQGRLPPRAWHAN